ncbi:MAG: T9SS type A sorting domain-containing protein [Flavobacteriales bacterium]|nr:T9SS type A sorting domain-containing protein [Flavobacteriales bacterium]
MKHIYTFSLASFVLSNASTAQVNNGGFEAWTGQVPNGWSNNNIAPANLFPVTSSDDAHGGILACRGEVIASTIAIPPILQNLAQPVTGTPTTFTGWYKFGPQAAGDLLSISVTVVDAGGGLVAAGIQQYTEGQATYAQFSVPLVAYNTNAAATATISFGISGTGGSPTVGSWFLLDDLELATGTGIGEGSAWEMAVGKPYPQPATAEVFVPIRMSQASRINAQVFDLQGRALHTVADQVLAPGEHLVTWPLPTTLANGHYVLRLVNGNTMTVRPLVVQR